MYSELHVAKSRRCSFPCDAMWTCEADGYLNGRCYFHRKLEDALITEVNDVNHDPVSRENIMRRQWGRK